MSGSVRVTVNGTPRELRPGTTVSALVDLLAQHSEGIAVAVNREVVTRGLWGQRELAEGDRVEVLAAVQGG
jgi:sulfur carrier protein